MITTQTVKYVLLNSSGTVVRQTTFEDIGGDFPSVAGDNTSVYAVYRKASAIKVKRSTDAGVSWNAINDITFSDSYCSGVDAVADGRGLHVAYATRSGPYPIGAGPWETYYQRYWNGAWEGYKNVTDYTSTEVGGSPTVTTSANMVHVSYNTGTGAEPGTNSGDAKTRDYNFSSQQWQTPQLVFGTPSGQSMGERIFSDGIYLHMFYYKVVNGPVQYYSDTYHTKRTISGTTWSSSTLIESYSDVYHILGIASSLDGKLHIVYPHSGLKYQSYNGTNWSSAQLIGGDAGDFVECFGLSSKSNDLYVSFKDYLTTYLKYRQYDAAPAQPQNLVGSVVFSNDDHHPGLTWTGASEPDVVSGGYVLIQRRTKIGSQNWSAWSQIDQIAGSSSQYVDLSLYCEGNGADSAQYKIQTKDVQSHLSVFSEVVSVRFDHGIRKPGSSDPLALGPSDFRLSESYPNPFNPSTTIEFELPRAANVSLVVYDVLGRELATLAKGYHEAGYHSVVWDASSAASGVYFARITMTDDVGKIVFAKPIKLLLAR